MISSQNDDTDSAGKQTARVVRKSIRSTAIASPVLLAGVAITSGLVMGMDVATNGELTGDYTALAVVTVAVGLFGFAVVSAILHAVGEVEA